MFCRNHFTKKILPFINPLIVLKRRICISNLYNCPVDQYWIQHFLERLSFISACKTRQDFAANISECSPMINTLRPWQNGPHFADIFKRIFLNENYLFHLYFTVICSQGSNYQYVSIGSDDGLAPIRPQWVKIGWTYWSRWDIFLNWWEVGMVRVLILNRTEKSRPDSINASPGLTGL